MKLLYKGQYYECMETSVFKTSDVLTCKSRVDFPCPNGSDGQGSSILLRIVILVLIVVCMTLSKALYRKKIVK